MTKNKIDLESTISKAELLELLDVTPSQLKELQNALGFDDSERFYPYTVQCLKDLWNQTKGEGLMLNSDALADLVTSHLSANIEALIRQYPQLITISLGQAIQTLVKGKNRLTPGSQKFSPPKILSIHPPNF